MNIMVIGNKIKDKAKEYTNIQMGMFIKVNLKTIKKMVWERWNLLMEIIIEVIGCMVNKMVKE